MLTKIGADATGLPFNSIMAILLEKDHPFDTAGKRRCDRRLLDDKTHREAGREMGGDPGIIEGLCGSAWRSSTNLQSETATNFNNKSIAWLLKNYSRIYDDPDMALDLYTRQCSIGVRPANWRSRLRPSHSTA